MENATQNQIAPPAEPTKPSRQKKNLAVFTNSVHVEKPERTEIARLGFAVDTDLSAWQAKSAEYFSGLSSAVKAGKVMRSDGTAIEIPKGAKLYVKGQLYVEMEIPGK